MEIETTVETITATRALSELKLLDKRIQKKTQSACFLTSKIGNEIKNNSCTAESDLQSITDLISRRAKIKSALMRSNSTTVVKISSESMTVAEAIEKKSSIDYLANLLDELRDQRYNIQTDTERNNSRAQERLDNLLVSTFGKDLKARPSEITEVSDVFWKANKCEVVDDIEIDKKITELDEYIDNFMSEIDLCLSEINAKTEITL